MLPKIRQKWNPIEHVVTTPTLNEGSEKWAINSTPGSKLGKKAKQER